jgi:hypothetical protein
MRPNVVGPLRTELGALGGEDVKAGLEPSLIPWVISMALWKECSVGITPSMMVFDPAKVKLLCNSTIVLPGVRVSPPRRESHGWSGRAERSRRGEESQREVPLYSSSSKWNKPAGREENGTGAK